MVLSVLSASAVAAGAATGYNTNDGVHTEKVDPIPTPEPDKPANADGAKCQVCETYLTDWVAVDPVCGTAVGYERLCPKCQVKYTKEEMHKMGVNDSNLHVDFMIGTADLSIVGIKRDGSEFVIFENGLWAF